MKIYAWPILLGILADVGFNLISGTILFILKSTLENGTEAHLVSISFGIVGVVLAGYVTSRKSIVEKKYVNSSVLGLVFLLGTLGQIHFNLVTAPAWLNLIAILSTIPTALLGAYLERKRSTSHGRVV